MHKLIVAARRRPGSQKDLKDLGQANRLTQTFEATARVEVLQEMFDETRQRGPAWREALDMSLPGMEKLGMAEMTAALLRKT